MSALSQSYHSIEFILVNDCCTDGTFDVVEYVLSSNERCDDVRIFTHTQNQGVSASRNQIIDEARGEYLYFMDSDDIIAKNTIELLMQNARRYDAEVVFGSYKKIETSGKKTIYQYPCIQLLEKNKLASFAYRKYDGIQASACNYIVKTNILRVNNHRFINVNYWEDLVFTFDLVTFVSRAVLLPDITYIYRCRDNSLSHYQERINISKAEVMGNVEAIAHLKSTSVLLYDKVYFPSRCYNIVMTDFYIACAILKRRKTIIPYITNNEIKAIMSHPASWHQICSFHNSCFKNQLLYILGKTPSSMCVFIIKCLGKLKKLI
jgi:glycosyltransferase involved in cell wall biosynthesis